LEKSLHYLLLITHTSFYKKILSEVAEIGLSPGQPKILEFLKTNNGCEQKKISQSCELEPATVTGILGRMENTGLIERKQLNGNRRSLYVFLTEKGKKKSNEIDEIFKKLEKKAFVNISEEKQKDLLEMLFKLYTNLSAD